MDEYTTVEEQVKYGLDTISPDRTIEVSLRDLLFMHQVLGEFVRFFHQPLHYPDRESVERFLGTFDEDAFALLKQCYYYKLRDVWPDDIVQKIKDGYFDHPQMPYYYKPTDPTSEA